MDGFFFKRITTSYEFKNETVRRDNWEVALALCAELTSPDEIDFERLVDAIKTRDLLIRRELIDFVNGAKHRVDLNL